MTLRMQNAARNPRDMMLVYFDPSSLLWETAFIQRNFSPWPLPLTCRGELCHTHHVLPTILLNQASSRDQMISPSTLETYPRITMNRRMLGLVKRPASRCWESRPLIQAPPGIPPSTNSPTVPKTLGPQPSQRQNQTVTKRWRGIILGMAR